MNEYVECCYLHGTYVCMYNNSTKINFRVVKAMLFTIIKKKKKKVCYEKYT